MPGVDLVAIGKVFLAFGHDPISRSMPMSTCSRCQKTFECGMVEATSEPCWCTALPPLPADALDDADDTVCLCPDCLKARIAALADRRGS
jgi:hypothetical protein